MCNLIITWLMVFVFWAVTFTPLIVHADQLLDGQAAHNSGDYATAIRLWRPLAEKGNADAQFGLGRCYLLGEGITTDYEQARKWFELSAKQANVQAQNALGIIYRDGLGVKKDYTLAAKWFRLAADQGLDLAQYHLGGLYYWGAGVEQDYVQAAEWFWIAAQQGFAPAQFDLAKMHATGKGIKFNYVQAYLWFALAERQGRAKKIQKEEMARLLTPSQLAEAKELVEKWTPSTDLCKVYSLRDKSTRFDLDGYMFLIKNAGQDTIAVRSKADTTLNTVIEPKGGEVTIFVGDERFKYYLELPVNSRKAITTVCMVQ
jgi:hypothetical protein